MRFQRVFRPPALRLFVVWLVALHPRGYAAAEAQAQTQTQAQAQAQAQQAVHYGTPTEARAMLDRVVAALRADESTALEMFTSGADGFREKDLYPYCGGPDGNFTAHPALVGRSLRSLMDRSTPPKPVGREIYAAAKPGEIGEVTYTWTRPGGTEPTRKTVYFTKVGDEICAVGYYGN